MRSKWGIEIPRSAQIGKGFFIGHSGGIVVSGYAIIGENFTISQQVTIGKAGKGHNRGAPTIGSNVYVAPGAKIFGKIQIGDNVYVGANAVVHGDVPSNCTVALIPGYTILQKKLAHKE